MRAVIRDMDLSRAVMNVALPFESAAFEEGKTLLTEIEAHVHCRGDEEMIKQLVVILLGNAFKYADEHGTIRVGVRQLARAGEITVSNTGRGISRADRERIFDRFYRADTSHNRDVEGNGLGLSIALSIAEAHKAKITVSGEEGEETVFTVQISGGKG